MYRMRRRAYATRLIGGTAAEWKAVTTGREGRGAPGLAGPSVASGLAKLGDADRDVPCWGVVAAGDRALGVAIVGVPPVEALASGDAIQAAMPATARFTVVASRVETKRSPKALRWGKESPACGTWTVNWS